MSFQQFADYIWKQEKKLSLVFRNVDDSHQGKMRKMQHEEKNFDDDFVGKFDAEDLLFYFQKLGINLELNEAKKLVEK